MLVEILKDMIKEETYYRKIDNVLEIWREKEKLTGEPYFIVKLMGSDKE